MTQKPQVKKPIDKIKTKGESNYKQKEKKIRSNTSQSA